MKERLVGAVVLVGLIVALVPEMLSGPRRPATDSRAPQDGSVRVHTIDLAPPKTLPEAPQSEPAEAADEPLPAPRDGVATEPQADQSAGGDEQQGASPREQQGAGPGAGGDEPSRPATPPAPAPAGDDAALASGWAVQLGSFASQENAERLASQVRKSGYRAFVSRFESGSRVRYRVRVGPEQDRAQAERLARRLERDGRQVSVVSHP